MHLALLYKEADRVLHKLGTPAFTNEEQREEIAGLTHYYNTTARPKPPSSEYIGHSNS
jgi:hypothetical protein